MIVEASSFTFEAPPQISRARRVLIKPDAAYPLPYPATTSREILGKVIAGIRKVSDADIILLESGHEGKAMAEIYRELEYYFSRLVMLDVRNCALVEVENPLTHAFAMATFWIPNIILSCDYLISLSCFKILGDNGHFTIPNLVSLLPESKYRGESSSRRDPLHSLDIQKVIADLYFTLPFDLGIIDAQKKLVCEEDPYDGTAEELGKTIIGDPHQVDSEASELAGVDTEYLRLIETAEAQLEPEHTPG